MSNGNNINLGRASIDYTARDFETIKKRLVEYVKINYPDTYKDFNASSFGSLMFDLVAYVGDTLSFYTDYVASESNLATAQEQTQVEDLAAENGFYPGGAALVRTIAQLGLLIPANPDGTGLAEEYIDALTIMAGQTVFTDQTGLTFSLDTDQVIDLSSLDSTNFETVTIDGSTVKFFGVVVDVPLVCGRQTTETFEVGEPNLAARFYLENSNVSEVLSVISAEGNEWYRVPSLAQNYIWVSRRNQNSSDYQSPAMMVKKLVPRRFELNKRGGRTYLQFGNSSESAFNTKNIAEPAEQIMKLTGKPYISDTVLDPTKLTQSESLGIAPANTTVAVTYRYNERSNVNVPARALNVVSNIGLFFGNEGGLDPSILQYIRENVTITNKEPVNGDISELNTEEIKHRAKGAFASQRRAVTLEDYKSAVYAMANTYGKVKRCNIVRDTNDYRRSLTMYIMAEDSKGKLQVPSTNLLQSAKSWVNQYRMVSDSVDIFPAKLINLGIEYDIVPMGGFSMSSLTGLIREALFEEITSRVPEIGEHFSLSDVQRFIQNFEGVEQVNNVRVVSKTGAGYDANLYNIEHNMSASRNRLYVEHDHIWEIKNATDISMKRDRPRRK